MHFLSCAGEFNHHGKYMCDSMYQILRGNFLRITTHAVDLERVNLGYQKDLDAPYNSVKTGITSEEIAEVVSWCDVMDYGAAPEAWLHEAVKQGKVVFIRIERLFKEGRWKLLVPSVAARYYRKYIRYKNNPKVYFLCVSAYAADDLKLLGIEGERVLQWAYCPEFMTLEPEQLSAVGDPLQLLWCGRMIDWKHPEMAIEVAKHLKRKGCHFELKMIGDGALFEQVRRLVETSGLSDVVILYGAVEARKVREYMIAADFFLATSDQNEGWGVVINEAMNSGCAVLATPEMGAVPVLIQNGVNGYYIYRGHEQEAAEKILELCNNKSELTAIKSAAYETIKNDFSPDKYAERFVKIAEEALVGRVSVDSGLGECARLHGKKLQL